jgi:putative ABC transport system permease protein
MRALLPSDDREVVLGDLAEEFDQRLDRDGGRSARRWYWIQVWRSIAPSLERRLHDAVEVETSRESLAGRLVGGVATDLRDAARSLRSTPGPTFVAVSVLTLGIGATTAVFSVVDAVALRGLPFDEPDRLMAPSETWRGQPSTRVSPQDFVDWRARQDVFEGIAVVTAPREAFRLADDRQTYEGLRVTRVSANIFSLLRVQPQLGRTFSPEDERDATQNVAVISDALWRAQFGADPGIAGTLVRFSTGTWEIIGVMPAGFSYPVGVPQRDLWVPYVMTADERTRGPVNRNNAYLQAVARLKPGVTIAQARARMAEINAAMTAENPAWFKNVGVIVPTLQEAVVGSALRSWMLMVLGAVACVLLMAVANVANLQLARATVRAREIGVRAALGATRARIIRSLLVESVLLSLIGAALGVALAYWGVGAITRLLPPGLPRAAMIAVNARVLVTAVLIGMTTGVAAGLVPAAQGSRVDLLASLREGGRSGTASAGRHRARTALLIAEVSAAAVLLVGAGLFVSSFIRVMRIDVGLDHRGLVAVGIHPQLDGPANKPSQDSLNRAARELTEIADRARVLPGVQDASILDGGLPLSETEFVRAISVPGREPGADDRIDVYRITPEYPKTAGVSLRRGRLFGDADNRPTAAPVVLLNEVAAAKYLGDRDALGATVDIDGLYTVVGIVAGTRTDGPETEVRTEAYVPIAKSGADAGFLMFRTQADPGTFVTQLRAIVSDVAPDARVGAPQSLDALFSGLVARRRFNMALVGLFGVLAIAIATVGIYGVVSYLVEQRSREIGVRLALGAVPGKILQMILWQFSRVVGIGVAIGLLGAWMLSSLTRSFLFRVEPHDPLVFGGAAALLLLVGVIGSFVPARRAAGIEPVSTLRSEN